MKIKVITLGILIVFSTSKVNAQGGLFSGDAIAAANVAALTALKIAYGAQVASKTLTLSERVLVLGDLVMEYTCIVNEFKWCEDYNVTYAKADNCRYSFNSTINLAWVNNILGVVEILAVDVTLLAAYITKEMASQDPDAIYRLVNHLDLLIKQTDDLIDRLEKGYNVIMSAMNIHNRGINYHYLKRYYIETNVNIIYNIGVSRNLEAFDNASSNR